MVFNQNDFAYRGTTGIQQQEPGVLLLIQQCPGHLPISNPRAPRVSSAYTKLLSFLLVMLVIKALAGIGSTNKWASEALSGPSRYDNKLLLSLSVSLSLSLPCPIPVCLLRATA